MKGKDSIKIKILKENDGNLKSDEENILQYIKLAGKEKNIYTLKLHIYTITLYFSVIYLHIFLYFLYFFAFLLFYPTISYSFFNIVTILHGFLFIFFV